MNEGEISAGLAPTSNYRYAAVQAGACLDNLFTLIDHHGFSRRDIHQLTVYVVGTHDNLVAAWREVVS